MLHTCRSGAFTGLIDRKKDYQGFHGANKHYLEEVNESIQVENNIPIHALRIGVSNFRGRDELTKPYIT